MGKDLNQCNFIGRLGKEPDIKYSGAGKAMVNFSIACGDDYKDKTTNQKVEQTNWVNIVAFGRLAEIIGEYCEKGSKVFVTGKQITRKWQNKEGIDQYTTEIVANNLQMLDSRPEGGSAPRGTQQGQQQRPQQAQQQAPAQQQPAPGFDDFDDDIPF